MFVRLTCLGLTAVLIGLSMPVQAQETQQNSSESSESTPEQNQTVQDVPFPSFPSNCELLPVVGGEGSEITKTVSPPSLSVPIPGPINARTRNNWQTDWFMPAGPAYISYMVIFMPRENRNFDVSMSLRFPDARNQRFYRRRRVDFRANEPITVEVTPERTDLVPFQVNTNIGGIQAVGARYTVAAAGCR